MPHFSKLLRLLALGAAAVTVAQPAIAADNTDEIKRISNSIDVVDALLKTPDDAIPEYILERAEAIVVIPTLVKGGFVIGAEHGKGIMSVRDRATGSWSVPTFVAMTGGSIGWQIGVQSVDLVLLVMNKDGVDDLLASEFKLGADASVAAGPVGRTAQAATDARMGAKILAYSRAKGLFAGVSVQGSSLRDDTDANEALYGKAYSAKEVFAMPASAMLPPVVARWRQTLRTITPASR
ncbi:MAG: lipid-binding SYLF domain-containing protein [Acidobacteria bacterium]|nr:lipid-binding SYLF domain-containing protein [Acidobacteriota bacterium]